MADLAQHLLDVTHRLAQRPASPTDAALPTGPAGEVRRAAVCAFPEAAR